MLGEQAQGMLGMGWFCLSPCFFTEPHRCDDLSAPAQTDCCLTLTGACVLYSRIDLELTLAFPSTSPFLWSAFSGSGHQPLPRIL